MIANVSTLDIFSAIFDQFVHRWKDVLSFELINKLHSEFSLNKTDWSPVHFIFNNPYVYGSFLNIVDVIICAIAYSQSTY